MGVDLRGPGWLLSPLVVSRGRGRGEMADAVNTANVASIAAAQRQGEADAQHRMDYHSARPGLGVPAGSAGEHENRPLALPDDPAVTGTGGA